MLRYTQGKKSCSGPWVLTYRPWDLFHQTYSKTLNTFDGTDPMVDRLKPKVRNTIFFPVTYRAVKGLRGIRSLRISMSIENVLTHYCNLLQNKTKY